MTRVENIISRARVTLSDPHKSRWSDTMLLALLNEAQVDMATKARLLTKVVEVPVFSGVSSYGLPDNFISMETAFYCHENSQTNLKLTSLLDIQKQPNWQSLSGNPSSIIFNIDNRLEFRLFPTPSGVDDVIDTKEVVGGIVSGEGLNIDNPYGVVTNIDIDDIVQSQQYGIVTNVKVSNSSVKLFYKSMPKKVTALEDDLEIAPTCDQGLKYYIVAMALRDDMDSMNRAVAREELALYAAEVHRVSWDSATDYVTNDMKHVETRYNGGLR